VAFFVTIVGTRFWRIACLTFHIFIYSSKAQRDGLYHQRQALLRNASNAETGFVTLFRLAWAWRRIASGAWRRILPLLVFTFLCVCGWAVATGFSSKVSTTAGEEVLISSPNCGTLNGYLDLNLSDIQSLYNPYMAKIIQTSASYAQQCYSSNTSGALGCDTFVQKRLATTVIANASCPFSGGICQSNNSNLILDTGLLDSNDDFGLNAPSDQRFQYRRVVQCAPMVTQGYTSLYNLSSDRSYTRYWYGEHIPPNYSQNYTREFSNDALYESKATDIGGACPDYSIG
jgi:hypothetical protein